MEWSIIPAVLLSLAGLVIAFRGFAGFRTSLHTPVTGNSRNELYMTGFRSFVLGAAFIGVGAALALDATWLLLLSLVIGGEELLESTLLLDGLRRGSSILAADEVPSPLQNGRTTSRSPPPASDAHTDTFGSTAFVHMGVSFALTELALVDYDRKPG
jgi:hypothetical protein